MSALQIGLAAALCGLILACAALTLSWEPREPDAHKAFVLARLRGLGQAIRHEDAASRMQQIFPEGACFTVTLYALAWTNLARAHPEDRELARLAVVENRAALERYSFREMRGCFNVKQDPVGAFFKGQKMLVLAQLIELQGKDERDARHEEQFHRYAGELHADFMKSATHHVDSYPGMCWPADNVTGLAALVVHDRLYGTRYRTAYEAWKSWTDAHLDPGTRLPAGRLDSVNGRLLEPARGCANSWMLGLIAGFDRPYAETLYERYRQGFALRRLGFGMFREYPAGSLHKADVDSGPIIWGAGMVATGVGLGTARALGDREMATDIHALSRLFGWPLTRGGSEGAATRYLGGALPVGDAFLAWGYSLPEAPRELTPAPSLAAVLAIRLPFYGILLALLGLVGLRVWIAQRRARRPAEAAR